MNVRRLAPLVIGLFLLAACGAPNVSINRAEFSIMYSDIKAQVSVWMFRIKQGCASKKLDASICAEIPSIELGLTLLDAQAKAMLRKADAEPDWATIGKYAEIAIGLAAKAAL